VGGGAERAAGVVPERRIRRRAVRRQHRLTDEGVVQMDHATA